MKKFMLGIVIMLGLVGFSQAVLLDEAVSWMNENDLTIFKTVTDYKPNNYIRRDEAAKLFVKFAKLQNKTTYIKTAEQCKFSDLNDAHKDLNDIIVESCRLGIFQGSNGKFMPRGSLTNEQAIAVLVRIVDKVYDETKTESWSDIYYQKANDFDILSDVSMSYKQGVSTRGDVGYIIYLANDLPGIVIHPEIEIDIQKKSNLQQISAALSIYELDNKQYPIYSTLIDTNLLSKDLVEKGYLIKIPIIQNTVDYYKTISKDNQQNKGFMLMTKIDYIGSNTQANFFGAKSILENKSFEEIKKLLDKPIYGTGDEAWYVLLSE